MLDPSNHFCLICALDAHQHVISTVWNFVEVVSHAGDQNRRETENTQGIIKWKCRCKLAAANQTGAQMLIGITACG